jgi:hypothetical protein
MRSVIFLLLAALPVFAATRTGIVKIDKAEVRNGASNKFDVTNELERGTQVEILEEMPGDWLKIKPPAGSISYVSDRLLDTPRPDGSMLICALENSSVPVYPGFAIRRGRTKVVSTHLKRGEIVVPRGEPVTDSDSIWLPIDPPPSEVRFIHRSALDIKTGTEILRVAGSGGTAGATATTPTSKLPSANRETTPEEDWRIAADAAYRGQHKIAVDLYEELARRTRTSHPHIAEGAMREAELSRQKLKMLSAGSTTPEEAWKIAADAAFRGQHQLAIDLYEDLARRTRSSHPHLYEGALREAELSRQKLKMGTAPGLRTSGTAASTPRPIVAPGSGDSRTTVGGEKPLAKTYSARLARAGWYIDRRPTYRIEVLLNGTYQEAGYAISGNPSLNLEPWIGKEVEVAGSVWYHPTARRNVITVTSIRAQQR